MADDLNNQMNSYWGGDSSQTGQNNDQTSGLSTQQLSPQEGAPQGIPPQGNFNDDIPPFNDDGDEDEKKETSPGKIIALLGAGIAAVLIVIIILVMFFSGNKSDTKTEAKSSTDSSLQSASPKTTTKASPSASASDTENSTDSSSRSSSDSQSSFNLVKQLPDVTSSKTTNGVVMSKKIYQNQGQNFYALYIQANINGQQQQVVFSTTSTVYGKVNSGDIVSLGYSIYQDGSIGITDVASQSQK